MVYKLFDKESVSLTDKSAKGGVNNEIKQNEQLISWRITQTNYWKIFKKEEFFLHLKTIFGVLI